MLSHIKVLQQSHNEYRCKLGICTQTAWPSCVQDALWLMVTKELMTARVCVCAAREIAAKLIGIATSALEAKAIETLLTDLSHRFPTAAKAADSKLTFEAQHGALAAAGCVLAQCQSGKPPCTCLPCMLPLSQQVCTDTAGAAPIRQAPLRVLALHAVSVSISIH